MSESIDWDDPSNPPAGYTVVDCPGCSSGGPKPRHQKMAVRSTPEAGVSQATSFCPVCKGCGWMLYRTAELEL